MTTITKLSDLTKASLLISAILVQETKESDWVKAVRLSSDSGNDLIVDLYGKVILDVWDIRSWPIEFLSTG